MRCCCVMISECGRDDGQMSNMRCYLNMPVKAEPVGQIVVWVCVLGYEMVRVITLKYNLVMVCSLSQLQHMMMMERAVVGSTFLTK